MQDPCHKPAETSQMVNEIAPENIQHSRQKQKQQYDKNTKEPNYYVGQTVLLHKPQVPKGLSPKLHNFWDGPNYITAECPNNTYTLRKCSYNKVVKSRIHANRLKNNENPESRKLLDQPLTDPIDDLHPPPQHPINIDDNQPDAPRPETNPPEGPSLNDSQSVDDSNKVITIRNPDPNEQHRTQDPPPQRAAQNMMERQKENDHSKEENHGYVEKLIQYKLIIGKKHFLVKWQGSNQKTWEPEENINEELIRKYHIDKTQSGRTRKRGRRRRTRSCFY